ncbi:MAG: Smr/MutS family protein [Vicinamibacterales bacterium]|nr:Smr/MutS family protein [Vicinamibacterales bacterium]
MHPPTLKALEFDRIVSVVRSLALTPLGDRRLAALAPSTDPLVVTEALATTSEAVRLLTDAPGIPLRAPGDLDEALAGLAMDGRALEPLQLLGLASFLESVDQCVHGIRRQPRDRFPQLASLVGGAASFEREIADVRRAIDPAGEVFDHASPALRGIRDRLRKQRTRLRGTLESYIRSRDTAKYLQEQVITDRNGRYVLLVRAEHRTALPGIVHGTSSSGASLFLEPLSTVDINNDIVALQEQEAEELHRILLELASAFRARGADLRQTLEVAAGLDAAQAKARFSRLCDGVAPELARDGRVELLAARHPLLIPAVEARLPRPEGDTYEPRPQGPVPVDVLLVPPTTVLVVTGPNTGGKTVALKTAGLLALMAQAGLHVPAAEGSRLPVFRSVFADIGDEQSIAANLSTFSWHVTNIVRIERSLSLPALVLLDEVGSGTDPVEGGALGMAVIDHFRRRGVQVVATTHYDTLKTYASTTEGVACAAFGFTPAFEPTYRLVYGSPGTSLALEMASRLGLPAAIVDAARSHRTEREAKLAEHLAKVNEELHALEHERRLVRRERQSIAEQEGRYRAREESLRQKEDQLKQRLEAQIGERLRDARREIDSVVEDVKRKAASLVSQVARKGAAGPGSLSTGDTGQLRAEARGTLEALAERMQGDAGPGGSVATARREAPAAAPAAAGRAPVPGDRVTVGPLGLEGIVHAVFGRDAEVEVRGKRLRTPTAQLRLLGGRPAEEAARVRVNVHAAPREGGAATELNVIGCTVDEAISRADKFLDEAVMAEARTVRLVHGHGTGQLRRGLAAHLAQHPQVAKFGPAPPEQGGAGATLVELKE